MKKAAVKLQFIEERKIKMFKFIKKIKENINKKVDSKLEEYANKNMLELNRITNRPLEGEIVKIENIKIPNKYVEPNSTKLISKNVYYYTHNYFRSQIVLTKDNYLIDGYTTYLLAKEKGFEFITIVRNEEKKQIKEAEGIQNDRLLQ